jgi:hypothetical protein
MCGGLAERRLDEALSTHPVPIGGDPYQHAVDILNGIYVDEDQKDYEIVDFLQIKQKPSEARNQRAQERTCCSLGRLQRTFCKSWNPFPCFIFRLQRTF